MVTDELLAQAEKYGGGEDKGHGFLVDLASNYIERGIGARRGVGLYEGELWHSRANRHVEDGHWAYWGPMAIPDLQGTSAF